MSWRNTRYILLFAVIFLVRWTSIKSPLPLSWTEETKIRFTAPILEEPRHTESKTIIEKGIWRIVLSGYQELDIGYKYAFVGKVSPRVIWGKTTQIEMVDPTFDIVKDSQARELGMWERMIIVLGKWRRGMVQRLQKALPEPHSSLAAGILLGVKGAMPYDFYQKLIGTGTVHVIAASGYNVTIVARVVLVPLLLLMSRGWAIVAAIAAIGAYVVIAGGSAAVVRAGIMGSLTLIAYYWGRPVEAKRLLWVTAGVMLLVQPLMILDVGFQLSVAATAGLLYLEPWVKRKGDKIARIEKIRGFLDEYLWPTLAAGVATAPVILATFGRISWISPLVNMLVLPLVPLTMFLTAVYLPLSYLPILEIVARLILYVPLEIFVRLIELLG